MRRLWSSVNAELRSRKGPPPRGKAVHSPSTLGTQASLTALELSVMLGRSLWPSRDVINARPRAPCLSQNVP